MHAQQTSLDTLHLEVFGTAPEAMDCASVSIFHLPVPIATVCVHLSAVFAHMLEARETGSHKGALGQWTDDLTSGHWV